MRILICGATGFIGRNLVEYFARRPEYDVHGTWHIRPRFHHERVTWHHADLRRADDVNRLLRSMDVVVQAAATTSGSKDIVERPYIHVTDNAVMNSLLLRAAFEHHVRHFIFFSCAIIYASSPDPRTEEDFDGSVDMHPRYFGAGWTKIYVEKMCQFYASLGRTKHTVIRHSNVYGPHDKFDADQSHVLAATVAKVTAADREVTVWGDGSEARDLVFIDDLVSFVGLVVSRQQNQHEVLNCGSGRAIAVRALVEAVIRASGRDLTLALDPTKPSIQTAVALDTTKARRLLGWAPETALDDGLRRTLTWYASRHAARSP